MLCFTNEARQSNIDRIGQLIDKLGYIDEDTLSFTEYCALVDYLSIVRDLYKKEMLNYT